MASGHRGAAAFNRACASLDAPCRAWWRAQRRVCAGGMDVGVAASPPRSRIVARSRHNNEKPAVRGKGMKKA